MAIEDLAVALAGQAWLLIRGSGDGRARDRRAQAAFMRGAMAVLLL
jgi:hypothetical protein